jgi:hypothetical protein
MQMKRKLVGFEKTLFFLVILFGLPSSLLAQRGPAPLVGTWEVTITSQNGGPTSNMGFVTFNADQTMTESSLEDLTPPVSSPGRGVWAHTEGNNYAATFKFFIVDPTGNLVCTARVNQTSTLNSKADQWSGPARFDCIDPNGNDLFGFDLSVSATRMKLEPLN